jgi:hypothetical protein
MDPQAKRFGFVTKRPVIDFVPVELAAAVLVSEPAVVFIMPVQYARRISVAVEH